MSSALTSHWVWFRNRVLPWLGLVVAVGLIVFAAIIALPRPIQVQKLSITAGNKVGTRTRIQELLMASANKRPELELTALTTAGSSEALRSVNDRKIDLALVQGGLSSEKFPHVRRIASLHVEPLHLLVRESLHADVSTHLKALENKTINLSNEFSGTFELATDLLSFFGIENFEATTYNYEDFLEGNIDSLPDAVFTVSSLPSPVAEFLITQHEYRLVQLPFADSFHLHWFENQGMVNRIRIKDAQIPAFAYQVDPGRPPQSLETFGTRLELVTHANLDSKAADALCRAVYESDFNHVTGRMIRPEYLLEESTFPLHTGTQEYLRRLQPVSTGRLIEVTEQLVGILGAALGAMLFLWQWMRHARQRRRDQEFVGCVERVVEIETTALRYDQDDSIGVSELEQMQNELGEIKRDLLRRYRSGEMEGADMLSAFLKHANDASELISRIVLHETPPHRNPPDRDRYRR